jgi:four helix bundle protein
LEKEERDFAFRKLIVWQKAVELADTVYQISERFPKRESDILIPQLFRAINSVPANIAEGSFRQSKKEFIQFLFIAKGSLAEAITYFELAYRQKYFDKSNYDILMNQSKEVLTLLVALINSFRKVD